MNFSGSVPGWWNTGYIPYENQSNASHLITIIFSVWVKQAWISRPRSSSKSNGWVGDLSAWALKYPGYVSDLK
jgi:hypothetical protein